MQGVCLNDERGVEKKKEKKKKKYQTSFLFPSSGVNRVFKVFEAKDSLNVQERVVRMRTLILSRACSFGYSNIRVYFHPRNENVTRG